MVRTLTSSVCYDTGSCGEAYWVSASANGVLSFVDQSASAGWSLGGGVCYAALAYAVNGSTPSAGTIVFAGVEASEQLLWAPAGVTGTYDKATGTITLTMPTGTTPTPTCVEIYTVDSASLPPGTGASLRFQAQPPPSGSAAVCTL